MKDSFEFALSSNHNLTIGVIIIRQNYPYLAYLVWVISYLGYLVKDT